MLTMNRVKVYRARARVVQESSTDRVRCSCQENTQRNKEAGRERIINCLGMTHLLRKR